MKTKIITNSMLNEFMTCRQKYKYRYLDEIIPTDTPLALGMGSAVHAGLEAWFVTRDEETAVETVSEIVLGKEDRIKCEEMIKAYIRKWGIEKDWKIEEVEVEFCVPLRNPATGRPSRTWMLAGKLDGLVRIDNELYVLEHKTTSKITDEYLWRTRIDSQIALYASQYPSAEPIAGAVYDILEKPGIRMKKGETEAEYEERKAALAAKSKSGTSSAKRQMPESDEDFRARLAEDLSDEKFRRVIIRFDEEHIRQSRASVWEAAKDIANAKLMYKNTRQCAVYGGCPYLPLCMANGDVSECPGMYFHQRAHAELEEIF